MEQVINPSRLKLARCRRQMTIKDLASKVGLTPRMVSEYEKDRCKSTPPESTLQAFSDALKYPISFLTDPEDMPEVSTDSVSFRSLKSMRASERDAAIGAGELGLVINRYFESMFELENSSLPDFSCFEPELAAELLRKEWGLGTNSISHMIGLLEKHGVRVFSLDELTHSVDAFSFWKEGTSCVFLNTKKSGERSRFDAAHELGHLVLHRNAIPQGRDIEREADRFAAEFLMPRETLLPYVGKFLSLNDIIRLKTNWKVSAMALIFSLKNAGVITEWQYRNLVIEASQKGLRTREIQGIPHESSKLIPQMLSRLEKMGISLKQLSQSLLLPLEEIRGLLFQLEIFDGGNSSDVRQQVKPALSLAWSRPE
ncbi:DNA-binding protein [Shewanella algae]|uniref:helix-turn-helix domain-containing protein n=1 Tax=Shewanella algae TaxID=38313 RepID=UPI0011822941|nr:XRE family transcriptional regulator [Shewanella algae]TVL41490.1 DNA-binding protein [Shewanella algae]